MTICVLDTETTGLSPETADIVELGVVVMPGMWTFSKLAKPTVPIELKAMAAHHLTEAMVAHEESIAAVIMMSPLLNATVLVAHNAEFDRGFIDKAKLLPELPWVCTWRCGRHIWPDAPGHSNQVLRYFLPDLNDELYSGAVGGDIMRLPPHRALPDAWITAHILKRLLMERSIEELIELTKLPILGKNCHFGKHLGLAWEDVPKSYLYWMMKQKPGFDSDTTFTVQHFLEPCQNCSNGCKKCNGTGFKYPLREEEIGNG